MGALPTLCVLNVQKGYFPLSHFFFLQRFASSLFSLFLTHTFIQASFSSFAFTLRSHSHSHSHSITLHSPYTFSIHTTLTAYDKRHTLTPIRSLSLRYTAASSPFFLSPAYTTTQYMIDMTSSLQNAFCCWASSQQSPVDDRPCSPSSPDSPNSPCIHHTHNPFRIHYEKPMVSTGKHLDIHTHTHTTHVLLERLLFYIFSASLWIGTTNRHIKKEPFLDVVHRRTHIHIDPNSKIALLLGVVDTYTYTRPLSNHIRPSILPSAIYSSPLPLP